MSKHVIDATLCFAAVVIFLPAAFVEAGQVRDLADVVGTSCSLFAGIFGFIQGVHSTMRIRGRAV